MKPLRNVIGKGTFRHFSRIETVVRCNSTKSVESRKISSAQSCFKRHDDVSRWDFGASAGQYPISGAIFFSCLSRFQKSDCVRGRRARVHFFKQHRAAAKNADRFRIPQCSTMLPS
jgi:hypothetical protein